MHEELTKSCKVVIDLDPGSTDRCNQHCQSCKNFTCFSLKTGQKNNTMLIKKTRDPMARLNL